MKIALILAGTNEPSNAETLAEAFLKGIQKSGEQVSTDRLKLSELNLEHFTLSHYDKNTDQGADFEKLKSSIQAADGLVIASPIWNFSVPAHLKNAIDRIGSFALDDTHSVGTLKGKPVFLLYTGGSPAPAWGLMKRTTSHMPISLQYFGACIVGQHYEGHATAGRGIFKEVLSARPERLAVAEAKGKEFGAVVARYAKDGSLPVKLVVMKKFFQFGGKMKKALGL